MASTRSISRGRCCNSRSKKRLRKRPKRLSGRRTGHPATRVPQPTNTFVVLARPDFTGRKCPHSTMFTRSMSPSVLRTTTSGTLQWTPFPEACPPLTWAEHFLHRHSAHLPHPRHRPQNKKCPLWARASTRPEFLICGHCSRPCLRRALSIVWALSVRMRTEADLTAVRATTGSWFLTLPMLRAIATHLEPISCRSCRSRL